MSGLGKRSQTEILIWINKMAKIIRNAKMITLNGVMQGHIIINNGTISSMGNGITHGDDWDGDYIAPGLVELHTDNIERHIMPRPKVFWSEPEASFEMHDSQIIASGITTVFDSICIGNVFGKNRDEILKSILKALPYSKNKNAMRADHFLHLRCELSDPGVIDVFNSVARKYRPDLVSLMIHSPYQRQWTNIEAFHIYYNTASWPENKLIDFFQSAKMANKKIPNNMAHVLRYCRSNDIPVASHDDTTLEHVDEAYANNVVIAEFPTTLEAAEYAYKKGISVMMGAPNLIRGGSHSNNVAAAEVARRNWLRCLSSDYVPASLLHGAWVLHRDLGWPIEKAIGTVTSEPAKAMKLSDRGTLEVGKRADLVRFALFNNRPSIKEVWVNGERRF